MKAIGLLTNYDIRIAYVDGKPIQYKVLYQPIRIPKMFTKNNEIFLVTSKKQSEFIIKQYVPTWIKHYDKLRYAKEQHKSITTDSSKIRILEKYYDVKQAILHSNKRYEIVNNVVYISSKYKKEDVIKEVYIDIIKPYVLKRVKYWQIKMGLAGRKLNIQITNMTYCLGLCYSKDLNNVNKIKFSSKLFGYNKEQIDHTIVHELAHIYHMNHKKEFWDVVKKYIPNSYELKKKLFW